MPHVDGVDDDGAGYGVYGLSNSTGVWGLGKYGTGVYGFSYRGYGVSGRGSSYIGVYGSSDSGFGMYGRSSSYIGVFGWSPSNIGVSGESKSAIGVDGYSDSYTGVRGWSYSGIGVHGYSDSSYGMYGASSSGVGVYGYSNSGYAAYLDGRVHISGPLEKPAGSFKIDHPLDPANKYLYHSFVESPDMKNVYDGVVVLDDNGEAVIDLPDWFAALNKDFRYQLTAIGAPGPNLYIAEEIIFSDSTTTSSTTNYSSSSSSNNNNNDASHFKIAGGNSGMKVSWQVTGIRKDPWANANRIEVEQDKPAKERGYYLHPDVYGQPEENGISHLLFSPQEEKEEEKWQEEQQIINK
jgi:hypothetical protein